ncbi:MAG: CHAP domain-containing protein [Fimbriimonadales bacterium]|nr:CHAP domain-containing protein [Fimbriimonadales bacterium]
MLEEADWTIHARALERAIRALEGCRGLRYRLGSGGFHPEDPWPSRDGFCDCSGFAAWCLGLSRDQRRRFGLWISSEGIWRDGLGERRLFAAVAQPFPGCLVAFPDRDGRQGHVGVVTRPIPLEGIDCSTSGLRRRPFGFFLARGSRFFAVRRGSVGEGRS